ncbi:transcription factor SOX-8-like [Sinocyclocheilus grahami]|uniref:transcription factor SOX-8-like n=1 Tax=Sinocyclocheilus grahami TaxID=75366 RepID=UPI0007AD382F|nr:PREDICTED: transcription factor SOX-8-like [Sinocyclocheilus grahami]
MGADTWSTCELKPFQYGGQLSGPQKRRWKKGKSRKKKGMRGAKFFRSGTSEASQHRARIKTEQLSPSHYSEHSPEYSVYSAHGSSAASASFASDYTDLQSSGYYSPYAGYPSGLYQYPYFHSSRRPYGGNILNGLSIPPSHSPSASWDQPVYTTLSRP